ncbi:GNAT family N-acetyltransferase [Afipia carboxidovorans]|uniref:GNAT family N-acetyltransferase n=1 Tax=Afipia carboxidovorans TaxID=40137 RepID=UPI00308A2315|nr:GNAT family N-acetyltransferase [Afipia carboxidovorans]
MRLRPYRAADEDALIALWQRTWQYAYPSIDFAERLPGWRQRWRAELVPASRITVAENDEGAVGFVTLDGSGYLDQLVVAPEAWGSGAADALVDEAKRQSSDAITLLVNADNARAIAFYQRHGFRHTHDDVNPTSGRKVHGMKWEK